MCGRFAMTLPPEAVRAYFGYVEQPNFPPRYNIAPTQPIPIVVARANPRRRAPFSPRPLGLPARLRQGREGVSAADQRARRDA
jgi:putative SOS response-associated peptidase YedK